MKDKINEALHKMEIPKELHERSKLGVKTAKAEQRKRRLKKSVQLNYKRWIAVASAFGILLSIMISMLFFSGNGELQVANFSITAYASSDDGNQLNTNLSSEESTFEYSTEDRVDGGLVSVSGDGANLIFTDVMLNITGENIDSITYTMNKGKFIEDVTLTAKERTDKYWLLSEKIFMILSEPNSDVSQGIKEIGNTYTVNYNEQDKYDYTLAIPHDGNDVIDEDIIIKVNVKYTDGNSEQQDILVTQESNSFSLKLN